MPSGQHNSLSLPLHAALPRELLHNVTLATRALAGKRCTPAYTSLLHEVTGLMHSQLQLPTSAGIPPMSNPQPSVYGNSNILTLPFKSSKHMQQ